VRSSLRHSMMKLQPYSKTNVVTTYRSSETKLLGLERFRFAALKLSRGRMDKLADAVRLANKDWRDLLVAAGFADSVDAHKDWKPV